MDEYQEISDLLMRYATLNATNEDVRKQQFDTEEASERLRAELLQYSKMKTDEILNLNNQISQLKKQLEAHQLENLDYESKKDHSLQVCPCPFAVPWGHPSFPLCEARVVHCDKPMKVGLGDIHSLWLADSQRL